MLAPLLSNQALWSLKGSSPPNEGVGKRAPIRVMHAEGPADGKEMFPLSGGFKLSQRSASTPRHKLQNAHGVSKQTKAEKRQRPRGVRGKLQSQFNTIRASLSPTKLAGGKSKDFIPNEIKRDC